MADTQTFDLPTFIENYSTPDILPELKPSKTTFYFPATPEDTRRVGLSYKIEGGTQGGGRFGDIDLRNHTLEKYDAGESKFVAIATPGVPTGEYYRMPFPDGATRVVRNVDTGGGLVKGQADIATSNPDLARGFVARSGGGEDQGAYSASTDAGTRRPVAVSEEEIDAIVGKKQEPQKERPSKSRASAGFTPTPIPQFEPVRLDQPFEIPQESQAGAIAQAIPQTQIPGIESPSPSPPQPSPEPMPTPDLFPGAVQEAMAQAPLFASNESFNPQAFIRQYAGSLQQTPTPSPTPTQTPTTTPFNPQAFIAQYTSPTELPTPSGGQISPSGIGQVARGLGEAGIDILKSLIPNTQNIRSFGTIMAAPQDRGAFIKQAAQTALSDVQLVKEARKAGLLSKETGKAIGHIGAQAVSALPALKVGAAMRVADEAAAIPKPPVQTGVLPENAVAGRTGSAQAIPEASTVTSQIANRFLPERQLANELGMVIPDGPIIPSDLIAAASQLPPEAIAQHISNLVHNAGGSFLEQSAAVVVKEAQLSELSSRLSKIARQNPTTANKLAAEAAFQDVTDFHNGPVTKMKGIWSAGGKVMQSSNPIDLASLNGQREAWLRDVGKAPPTDALPVLQKLADDMFKANQRITDLQQMWRADAQSLNPRVTPEMVREQILAKLKKMTPC